MELLAHCVLAYNVLFTKMMAVENPLLVPGLLQAVSWGAIVYVGASSVSMIAILLALSNMGASMVDVVNDALVAECSKKKKRSNGELQSFAWLFTASGGVLGHLMASLALGWVDYKLIFCLYGLLLLFQIVKSVSVDEASLGVRLSPYIEKKNQMVSEISMPKCPTKILSSPISSRTITCEEESQNSSMSESMVPEEEEHVKVIGIKQQFSDLVNLMKRADIAYPMAWFVASYACIPTLAGTMFYFQTQHLRISPFVIGLGKVLGQVGLMVGSLFYSKYSKVTSLRKLLGSIQVVLSLCALSDIVLVNRVNVILGIPDPCFVLGASTLIDSINQFKILPFTILLAQLCPRGKEGSLFAAFMSIQCLATIMSGYSGVMLAYVLNISSHDFSNLPLGICVQSMATLLPLIWISYIPEGKVGTFEVRVGKRT